MFTYDDFLNILEYLHTGTDNGLDPNTVKLATSEQIKSKNFIENTIDLTAFSTDDYKRLKDFMIDWYASHRTIVSTQKNASDIYSIPEDQLNELFYSFGFDLGESLRNLPYENKIVFFYDLVNLYKIKGTPLSVFKTLNYFNVPSIELCEYWLQKNDSGDLILRGRPILSSPGSVTIGNTDIAFEATLTDPHWMLTEAKIEELLLANKIRLPSKTPYYGIRPTYNVGSINVTTSYITRKVQDDYATWLGGGTLVNDVRCSLGLEIPFLDLYLGMIYIFKVYFNPPGENVGNFSCYDGTSLPTYEHVSLIYDTLTRRPMSRDEILPGQILFRDTFSRPVSSNILYGYSDAGTILNSVNPTLKTEIDYYIFVGKELECVSLLLQDYSTWLKVNISTDAASFSSYVLDFSSASFNYLDKAINFFKPYRARLRLVEKVYSIGNPLVDSVIPDDYLTTDIPLETTEEFYDYDTADSSPSFLDDSTSYNYYSREHFDTGSYFDIGASIDEEPSIYLTEYIYDQLNVHPPDSTSYVHFEYTLDSSGDVIYAKQDGGFVNLDEGWYFDSPFVSDVCQITVYDSAPPGPYDDIVFWWRGKGEIEVIPDYGTSSVLLFEGGSDHYSDTNDYNPPDESPAYNQVDYPTMANSSIMDSGRGWVLRFFSDYL